VRLKDFKHWPKRIDAPGPVWRFVVCERYDLSVGYGADCRWAFFLKKPERIMRKCVPVPRGFAEDGGFALTLVRKESLTDRNIASTFGLLE